MVDVVLREHEGALRQSPHSDPLRWPGESRGVGTVHHHPYSDQAREDGSSTGPANRVPRVAPPTVVPPR